MHHPAATLAALSTIITAALGSSLYLLPQPDFTIQVVREVDAQQAQVALEHWLGLDRLDTARPGLHTQDGWLRSGMDVASIFGSRKSGKTLLLAVEAQDANEIVPEGLSTSYTVTQALAVPSLVSSFVQKATTVYGAASVFTKFSTTPERILDPFSVTDPEFSLEFAVLEAFVDNEADDVAFGAFGITSLNGLRDDAHATGLAAVKAAISSAKAQNIRLALLVTPPTVHAKRAEPTSLQPPQQPLPPSLPPSQPIFSSGTCHSTADACTNATDACSGRGACASVKRTARECFVCACATTTDARGRTEHWAGDSCQKLDVSGTFTLLVGTVVVITLVAGASIALLASVGAGELPSVLAGLSAGAAQRHN